MFRILIASTVHNSKDYSMERWFNNIAQLDYPKNLYDLYIVDNSLNPNYVQRIKGYLSKYSIENCTIKHLSLPSQQGKYERVARSREVIRSHLLNGNWSAWFTWDNDQIIPNNALTKMVEIMQKGNYMMVNPNKWARENPRNPNTDFGCSLIRKDALENYCFSSPPGSWETGEADFKKHVLEVGGSYIDVYGIIQPIYHLDK